MTRFLILAAIVLSLPACAISPPTSMFNSLNSEDEEPVRTARQEVRKKPQAEEEAGISKKIGNLWGSMKSGLGISGEEKKTTKLASGRSDAGTASLNPQQARELINAYRIQNGLKPLRISPKLNIAALAHSKDLARSDRISHYGSDGSDTWERVRRTGYRARLTAENVGTGQRSLGEVFRGWQKSEVHNKNLLLADAEEMGIAMVYEKETRFKTFWTLVFGSPSQASAQAGNPKLRQSY